MTDPAKPAKVKKARGALVVAIAAFAGGTVAGGAGAGMAMLALGGVPGTSGGAALPAKPEVTTHPVEYVEIDNAFTTNLVDTGRYLQLRIAVSTTGGEGVTAALTRHKPAIVSAVLGVLGEVGEADVASRVAKDRLRAEVRAAINDVLKRAGVGGVDAVFVTSMVVQ